MGWYILSVFFAMLSFIISKASYKGKDVTQTAKQICVLLAIGCLVVEMLIKKFLL